MRTTRIVPALAIAIAGTLVALAAGAAEPAPAPPGATPEAAALFADDDVAATLEGADFEAPEPMALQIGPGPGSMGGWGRPGGMLRPRGGHGPMQGPDGSLHGGAAMEALKLTDAQREKLADLRDRRARQQIEAGARIATAMLDLRKLMRGDRPDRAAIEAQIDRLAQLRAEAQKARIGSLLEARTVLTAEQRRLLRERSWSSPGRGIGPGGMMGPGMGPGPGPRGDGD